MTHFMLSVINCEIGRIHRRLTERGEANILRLFIFYFETFKVAFFGEEREEPTMSLFELAFFSMILMSLLRVVLLMASSLHFRSLLMAIILAGSSSNLR